MNVIGLALGVSIISMAVAQGASASMPAQSGGTPENDFIRQAIVRSGNQDRFQRLMTQEVLSLSRDGESIGAKDVEELESIGLAALRGQQIGHALAFDLDSNGTVTKAEVERVIARHSPDQPGASRQNSARQVLALDLNNDGKVTPAEMKVVAEARPDPRILRIRTWLSLDPNRDGRLTIGEVVAIATERWKAADTDGSGSLSQYEIAVLTGAPIPATPRVAQQPPSAVVPSVRAMPPSAPTVKPNPPAEDEEIHLVGIYEGYTKTGNEMHGPRASVTVNRPGKKVTLVACSYAPVRWIVSAMPGTQIKQVLAFGHAAQTGGGSEFIVNGEPAQPGSFPQQRVTCPYQAEGDRFRDFVKSLEGNTGFPRIGSFRGAYKAVEAGFNVDAFEDRPELTPSYLKAVDPSGLPLIRFAASLSEGQGYYDLSGRIVEKVPVGGDGAESTSRKERYTLSGSGLTRISLESGASSQVPISLDVPPMSHASGIAYDSKRERVVVVTFGGEGYLYEYKPDTNAWRVISSMNGMDVKGLTYDAKSDLIYGLEGVFGPSRIVAIAPNGGVSRSVPFDARKFPGLTDLYDPGNSHPNARIVAVEGDDVVVLATPDRGGFSGKYRIYLVNIATGGVKLTGFRD